MSVFGPDADNAEQNVNGVDKDALLKAGGTMTGGLDMGANQITRVANPTNPQDATTKAYADAVTQQRMLRSGDTMTGVLTVNTASAPGRVAINAITDVAITQIENREVSVSKGNLVVGTSAGGPDVDINLRDAPPAGGIRLKRNADRFHLGVNNSGKLEFLHVDGDAELATICEFTKTGRITSLANPIDLQDAATKNYVDMTRVKPIITIWAEGRGRIDQFEYKFSFGDGLEGLRRSGYPMIANGRVLRMGLTAITHVGNARKTTVCITVNGEPQRDYKVSKLEGEYSAATIFGRPLEVGIGSVLNFMPTQTDTGAVTTVVSLLVELDNYVNVVFIQCWTCASRAHLWRMPSIRSCLLLIL